MQEGLPGSGPRSHSHDWDETFIVIDGDLTFSISGQEMTAKAGALVHLPAGTLHEFKIGENGAKMISITGPGSNAYSLFSELAAEIQKPPQTKKILLKLLLEMACTSH